MNTLARCWLALLCFQVSTCLAHPGSGIVVDKQGQVFFLHTGDIDFHVPGRTWRIDPAGHLISHAPLDAHWLVQDPANRFANTDLPGMFRRHYVPNLQRTAPTDSAPALIQGDGCPLAMDDRGNLYFASGETLSQGGGLQISRLTADGALTAAAPKIRSMSENLGGIKGLAIGPKRALYVAFPAAVLKVAEGGDVTTVANRVKVADCDRDLPPSESPPSLRGLAVDEQGVVFVAATGCRCVLKIAPDGNIETVLKAEAPWSPTGVATFRDAIYVLEYTNANAPHGSGWRPRVRRIGAKGEVTTLAEIKNDTDDRNDP